MTEPADVSRARADKRSHLKLVSPEPETRRSSSSDTSEPTADALSANERAIAAIPDHVRAALERPLKLDGSACEVRLVLDAPHCPYCRRPCDTRRQSSERSAPTLYLCGECRVSAVVERLPGGGTYCNWRESRLRRDQREQSERTST